MIFGLFDLLVLPEDENTNLILTIFGIVFILVGLWGIIKKTLSQESVSVDLSPEHTNEIKRLASNRKNIKAIKLVRKLTGLGLKDAKNYAEGL